MSSVKWWLYRIFLANKAEKNKNKWIIQFVFVKMHFLWLNFPVSKSSKHGLCQRGRGGVFWFCKVEFDKRRRVNFCMMTMLMWLLQLQTCIEESVEFITLKIQPTLSCSQLQHPLIRDKPFPTGKVMDIFLLFRSCSFGMTLQTELRTLHSKCCAAFLHFESGGFHRLCFDYFGFSLTLKVFNVGQKFFFKLFFFQGSRRVFSLSWVFTLCTICGRMPGFES